MQYEKISIDLERNHAIVRAFKRGGSMTSKVTDIGGVMRLFKDQTEHDTGDMPIIGENCVGIRRIYQRGNRGVVLVNGVNLTRDIYYTRNERTYRNIKLPSLLMAIKFQKDGNRYRINDTYLFAHSNIITGERDTLYVPPFGNVYDDSTCRICWGSAQPNRLDSLSQTVGVLDLFIGSGFNNDLFRDSLFRHPDYEAVGDVGELLNFLENREEERFPYDDVTLSRKMSYGELINYFQNNL